MPALSQSTNIVNIFCDLIFNKTIHALLDSGALCSVIQISHTNFAFTHTTLLDADGRHVQLTWESSKLPSNYVVKESIPTILGCDFLSKHGAILDYQQGVFHSKYAAQKGSLLLQHPYSCTVVVDDEHTGPQQKLAIKGVFPLEAPHA